MLIQRIYSAFAPKKKELINYQYDPAVSNVLIVNNIEYKLVKTDIKVKHYYSRENGVIIAREYTKEKHKTYQCIGVLYKNKIYDKEYFYEIGDWKPLCSPSNYISSYSVVDPMSRSEIARIVSYINQYHIEEGW